MSSLNNILAKGRGTSYCVMHIVKYTNLDEEMNLK